MIQSMKKLSFLLSVALLFPASAVFAETSLRTNAEMDVTAVEVRGQLDADANEKERNDAKTSSEVRVQAADERSATATAQRESRDDDEDTASTTSDDRKGDDVSSEHKSAVALFVQSLLRVADRDGGIGAEVRAVAQSQNDSASTTAEALAKVEKRSSLKSFLFGTDWKNIGTLRSEIAKGESDAQRLQTAIDQATDASVKADLQAQLVVMQAAQAKVKAFVDAHARSFSLFGWVTKIFVKTEASAE